MRLRNLILVLGDQLDRACSAFDGFDLKHDAVAMQEVREEATYIRQHKIRLVLFFSALRHFRDELVAEGLKVHYRAIDDPENSHSFAGEIAARVRRLDPRKVIVLQPGDDRVRRSIEKTCRELGVELEIREDRHFFCSPDEFAALSQGRHLILENFYRRMREKHGILMEGGKPAGDRWNFDKENRQPLTAASKKTLADPLLFAPDALTKQVIRTVNELFPDSPGSAERFDYPVTRAEAVQALGDFIEHRLPNFGPFQDAMTADEPYLYHSRLSSALNLHLLNPREVIDAAIRAYESGAASLSSVEGFVRQVLGWREFVRGIYRTHMPGYADLNELDAQMPVPRFFWTGETDMNCLRHAAQGLVEHAYAHHIHRLMVFGLFSLQLGVVPRLFHEWHMSMFVDAIDWVSLPNALGMSQYGDGGIMGTKPYCASGNYIHRMSDYCRGCRYKPSSCPFTVLYYDFLARHEERFQHNGRMLFQIKNLQRQDANTLRKFRREADGIREALA
jgi:deoxyribodipyrimidine photolyase-related protein